MAKYLDYDKLVFHFLGAKLRMVHERKQDNYLVGLMLMIDQLNHSILPKKLLINLFVEQGNYVSRRRANMNSNLAYPHLINAC